MPGRPATDLEQSRWADALADGDPCVRVEPDQPSVIIASIDVAAADLDEALQRGAVVFTAAARSAGLAGALTRLTAVDDDGYLVWPAV